MRGNTKMIKTVYALMFMFLVALSPMAYAASSVSSRFDVSIDRVLVNNQPVASGRNNFISEADLFRVSVGFTSLSDSENAHVEAVIRDLKSGNVVADTGLTYDIQDDTQYSESFSMRLIDPLDESSSFELTVKIMDEQGRSEQKTYGIRTDDDSTFSRSISSFDVSIDRVFLNGKVVSASNLNFVEDKDKFDVRVDLTAVDDMEDAHVEAVLRDRNTGLVVSDASVNFDIAEESSRTTLLALDIIDKMKKSDSFELGINIVDAEGHSIKKTYGIATKVQSSSSSQDSASDSGYGSLDVSIDSVEVEDEIIAESQTNYLRVTQRTKEIDVDVSLTALEDIYKARVSAVLSYENGDVVSDTTANFDFADDSTVTKKLEIPILASFEQEVFNLALRVSDEDGNFKEKTYTLKLTSSSYPVLIESIMLEPENRIDAGKSVVAKVQMENTGLVSLNGMTATVSIPELGVSQTKFLGTSKVGDEMTEEFILQVPKSAGSGQYSVVAEISQQFSSQKESKSIPITVVGTDEQVRISSEKLVINVPITSQQIEKNSEIAYPITFRNDGSSAKTYTLAVDSNWADVYFSDSNVFVLKPKESKTMNVYVSTDEKFSGTKSAVVLVNDNNGPLSSIRLDAMMDAKSAAVFSVKILSMILLILIVAALAVYAAYEGINRSNDQELQEEPEQEKQVPMTQPEPYY